MKRTVAPTLIAFTLAAAACSSGPGGDSGLGTGETDPTNPPTTDPDGPVGPIGFAPAALRQFDECDAFLNYVRTEGAAQVGPYGFGDGGWYGPIEVLAEDATIATTSASADFDDAAGDGRVAFEEEPAAEAAPPPNGGEGGDDGSFSTTNVQVAGVDEPDIVKTDGDRVLAITGETLHFVDISADGTDGTLRDSIQLGQYADNAWSYGHEIFFNGDRAFVIAQGESWGPVVYEDDVVFSEPAIEVAPEPIAPEPDIEPAVEPDVIELDVVESDVVESDVVDSDSVGDEPAPFAPVEPAPLPPIAPEYYGPSTIVIEVDLSNPDDLKIANSLTMNGRYISARAIGDTARVVVTSPPRDLGFVYPSNPAATDAAEQANRDLVVNSTVEDWIPTYQLTDANGGTSTGQLVSCENVHAPSDFAGFDMLSIVTLGLDQPLAAPATTTSIMASGDTIYASQDRLYVTTNVWLPPTIDEQQRGLWEEEYETAIHRFSIAGEDPAIYEASGSVEGHLLNQFSMNDRNGTFYVATTSGTPWNTNGSVSQIIAMEVNDSRLEEIGRVGGLGQGERIFSVRYVDDTAYVVTFRQIDPFYVVDIGDPRNMTVQGELKIPGFSSYLHPITDTLVLGVGQDATDEGFTTGTKVSLFDVSDPADPREIDVWTLPNTQSDAEFDHRAFLYWPATSTAVLPLTSWSDQFAGAVVLTVDATGITEQGRITHADDQAATGQTDCEIFDGSDLTEADGDLFWITRDGGQLQLCDAEDQGGATGLYCDVIPVEDLQYWYIEDDLEQRISLEGVDRVELCWPDWNGWNLGVRRTMVIDDQLWTLSNERLQANALDTLARTDVVDLLG